MVPGCQVEGEVVFWVRYLKSCWKGLEEQVWGKEFKITSLHLQSKDRGQEGPGATTAATVITFALVRVWGMG